MIDLRSDTVTQPSAAMREVMAKAETGDDVYGEDPSIFALQEKAAALMGMERALFVPSGTMANLIAYLCQTRPGDSIILHQDAHPYHYEGANFAMVAGLMAIPVAGDYGIIAPDTFAESICQIADPHFSHTTLLSLENTTNRGGGACYTVDAFAALSRIAREHQIAVHCDGARIFNAAIAEGVTPAAYATHCDSLSFCLSKGLGAPVGSLLCGSARLIQRALRYRKMLGGGMRQAGIVAAAGLYALEHYLGDLAQDHRRAAQFRDALESRGIHFTLPSPTNILYMETDDPLATTVALAGHGVLVLPHEPRQIRAVFHRDISDDDLAQIIDVFEAVLLQH